VSNPFVVDPACSAAWNADRMGKSTLFEGERLFVGLNAFEPGQEHAAHAHAGADKLYQVLEGRGEFTIGDETRLLERGGLAFAPSGVPHAVKSPGPGRLLVLVAMGPPPPPRK
jgi:quercetin dioxygenase-like cupin family protein